MSSSARSMFGVAVRGVGSLALSWGCVSAACAQATAPAPARAELSPAERAQRDADKVFHWIRLNADKAAVRPAVAPASKPVAAAAATVAKAATPPAGPAKAALEPAQVAAAAPAPVALAEPPTLLTVAAPSLIDKDLPPPPVVSTPAPALVEVEELPLTLISRVEPQIPRQLQNSLRKGSVSLRFMVRPDGSVAHVEAMQSTHKKLAQAAVEAVSQWRFAPVTTARSASVELGFQLE